MNLKFIYYNPKMDTKTKATTNQLPKISAQKKARRDGHNKSSIRNKKARISIPMNIGKRFKKEKNTFKIT